MKNICALIIITGGVLILYADPNKPWYPGIWLILAGWIGSYLVDVWRERRGNND